MGCRIKFLVFGLLLLAQSLGQTFGETYWNGLITYNPPIRMWGGDQVGNEGVPMAGFELRHESNTDGYAQVNFEISSITTLFVRGEPKEAISTIADLKKFSDSQLINKTNTATAVISFNGKEALATTQTNQNSQIGKYFYSITFFWKQNRVWLRSSLFSIWVNAEKPENFQKLIASLKTVQINTNLLVPKLAKDEMQLGMSQDETYQKCGEPLERLGQSEGYLTSQYLISIEFDVSKISEISYVKLRDVNKFAADLDRETMQEQWVPLNDVEAQKILVKHTNHGKAKWSLIAHNRWKRSDGAMAALTSRGLTIASAEMWPKIHLIQ